MNKENTKAIVKNELNNLAINNLSTVNMLDEKNIAALEILMAKLIKSNKSGITSVSDGLAILIKAQDLKLPFSTCIEHIHVINGKTGIDIHVIKALLSKAGLWWKNTKNYEPLYEYTDGINVYIDNQLPNYTKKFKSKEEANKFTIDNPENEIIAVYPVKYYKDLNGNIHKDYWLNNNYVICTNNQQIAKAQAEKKLPIYRVPNIPVDYITEYTIYRNIKDRVIESIGSFSYNEAKVAGLLEKDTYIKYAKTLIAHRAFTFAARDIASDILFGCMETTELKIVNGIELNSEDIIDINENDVEVINDNE